MSKDFPREAIERAARIYNSNKDAALALGINPSSFGRLCKHYRILTPQQRRRAQRKEVKGAE